ncbi:MAG: hypothetical protein QXH75_07485 [Sulfolobaceae archaeon]
MNDFLGKFMLKEPVYKIEDLKINSEGAEIPILIIIKIIQCIFMVVHGV